MKSQWESQDGKVFVKDTDRDSDHEYATCLTVCLILVHVVCRW